MNTDTLTTATTAALDLFSPEIGKRSLSIVSVPIVSKKDADKELGRRITFDVVTLAQFKASLADTKMNAAEKKKARQVFLNSDAVKQRQMLGAAAMQVAMQPDEHAPMGRVPDVMELRKNGTIKLVSVEQFLGVAKESAAQKIKRLEKELREAKNLTLNLEPKTVTLEPTPEQPTEEAPALSSEEAAIILAEAMETGDTPPQFRGE